jgi:serine/threonine kinase 16
MCYFKSPFDVVYERGDSVALATMSGNITFPEPSPYNAVRSGYVLTPNSLKETVLYLYYIILHTVFDMPYMFCDMDVWISLQCCN